MKANPFNITKAVDFSDNDIRDYWVDFFPEALSAILKPLSPIPMYILGGKGSGKTHLMRYYSYKLQKLRNIDDILSGIKTHKYSFFTSSL